MNMMAAQMKMPRVSYSVTKLGGGQTQTGVSYPGGLDLTTPSLALQPGALRDVLNYECSQSGGYARIQGYERFSGQPAPNAAIFQIVQVSSFTNVPPVGQPIIQANTGATGTVAAVNNVAGAYYMVVTQIEGTFDTSSAVSALNNLTVNASNSPFIVTAANSPFTVPFQTPIGTAIPATAMMSALLTAQYTAAAADIYRAQIGPVPGSGPIIDVIGMIFNGVDNVYAFRANASGTAVNIWQASPIGWIQVRLFNLVTFTAGNSVSSGQPADGGTLTQGGVTATIQRVMSQSGAWANGGGTAVGAIVIQNPVGGNFHAGTATTADGATITLNAVQSPIVIQPGGHGEHVKCNFSGQLVTRRIYGCDGVNQCFEFDGVTYAPISTGLSPDMPSHIYFHNEYLWISQGSSIFYCGVGTPFKWDSIDGGGEIATGDAVTGMITLPGSQTTATMAVFMTTNTAFLYGTDPTTFNFVTFNTGLGALPRTAQNLFDTFFFDTLGAVTLRTTLNWGNFLPSTLTKNILPFILQERDKLCASSIMRQKSQYRLFFSDGYGLWITMINQQYLGASVVQFPNPVYVCDETVTTSGAEVTYFGSNDGLGYVYQMDTGTSFDGADLNARALLAWDAIKSPRILKRFRAASIEMASSSFAEIQFGYQLGYNTPLIGQPTSVPYSTNFVASPYWDSFTWDSFTWDGLTLAPTDVDVTGTAENIQVLITSGTNYIDTYNLNSVIHHYSPRRGIRV